MTPSRTAYPPVCCPSVLLSSLYSINLHSTAKRDSPTLGGLTTAESVLVSPVSAHSLTSGGASMHDMLAASTKSSEIMLMTTSPVSMMLRKL